MFHCSRVTFPDENSPCHFRSRNRHRPRITSAISHQHRELSLVVTSELPTICPVVHHRYDSVRFWLENAESIVLIRQFMQACVRADLDEFASYFCEDAIWWNSPWPPVKGRAAIRETLRIGAGRMTASPWDIRHIVADGDVVMTERVDHFQIGGKRISVPCMGIFELRNGKIAAWRDYWDLKTFEAQLHGSAPANS